MSNSHRLKNNAELSPYQKRIDSIDSPILCVAEVEKMINEIGRDLVSEVEIVCRKKSGWMKSRSITFYFRMDKFR